MGRGRGAGDDRRRAVVARGEVRWVEHPEAGRRPFTRRLGIDRLVQVCRALKVASGC
jgi:hypothetical protein